MKRALFAIFISLFIIFSCNKQQNVQQTKIIYVYEVVPDSNAILIADSIIYSVIIKNPDTNDLWTAYCLRYTDREKLIDFLFNAVYQNKLTAYSYRDWLAGQKTVISPDSIRRFEQSIGKDRIGKIEFVERWFYNPEKNIFYKQILELTLGYELYDVEGRVRSYAPVFKVSFNQDKKLSK